MEVIYIKTPIGVLSIFFDEELKLIKIAKTEKLVTMKIKSHSDSVRKLIDFFNDYFLGKPSEFDYPIKLDNISTFNRKVLECIKQIPFGQTVSYKWAAEQLGTLPRVVGQALKRNPLPIVIPCHRVIKSDGKLGGYLLGVESKKWLIEHEKSILYKLQLHKT
jgi:methylated-DNA-[protein]-cysteine S-methyltransferase